MSRKFILAGFLVFLMNTALAQFTIGISGTATSYEGSNGDYTVAITNTGTLPMKYQFVASATNGIIITQNLNPVFPPGRPVPLNFTVQWDCNVTSGSVTVTETYSGISTTVNVSLTSFISDPNFYCSTAVPAKQNLLSGQTPQTLDVTFCSPSCHNIHTWIYQYQWQVGDVTIGTFPQIPASWSNISGFLSTFPSYDPPPATANSIKAYRRITTFSYAGVGYTKYSSIAIVSTFETLNAGTIGGGILLNTGITAITQTPATGGTCDGYNYTYTWELSTDNGISWNSIGAGVNFPTGATIPNTFAVIRRKVICNGEVGYTNVRYFNPSPVDPGTITNAGSATVTYNSIPSIDQTSASGSVCNTGNFLYEWERSISNSSWVNIGNDITYPAGVGIVGNTRIRRKAKCINENINQIAYSNIITINLIGYTPPTAENLNFIKTKSILLPGIGEASQVDNLNTGEQIQEATYLDGLGRKEQTVVKQYSPLYKDAVSLSEYDQFGLESIKKLSFISNVVQAGDVDNDGLYKVDGLLQQNAFYTGSRSPVLGQGETFFYSQTDYELSPLNRIQKSFSAGNNWVGTRGLSTERSLEIQYLVNTKADDAVRVFTISDVSGSFPISSGTYNDGELYKTISNDEAKHKVVEFKDKTGNIILKKIQLDNIVVDGHNGWLCTYYIYDDVNNLKFVLPPKATEAFLNGRPISTFADELCFSYEYDSRKRVIIKKVPSAAKVSIVYDQRDRIIMTQDGKLANPASGSPQWMVTEYDNLNRPVRTGLLNDTHNQDYHAILANQFFPYPNIPGSGYEILTESYYDNYNWTTGTSLSPIIDQADIVGSSYFEPTLNAAPLYAQPMVANYAVKGIVTGTKVKVLGTVNQYLYNINFYDDRGRVIQTQGTNVNGGKDIVTNQYNFIGKPLRSLQVQISDASSTRQIHKILTTMEYDHAGRLLIIRKGVNSTINGNQVLSGWKKVLVQNSYDELGQTKVRKLGTKPGSSGELESLNYDYNIRGWLLGMNRSYLATIGQAGSSKFGYDLGFDKITNSTGQNYTVQQFNGNITGIAWKSDGDDIRRKYDFTYDNVNRFLRADFKQQNESNSLWNNLEMNYDVKMGDGVNATSAYDANGNIKAMIQYGFKLGTPVVTPIDNLTYSYFKGGNELRNQLQQVVDANNIKDSKLGDFKYDPATKTATDYTYDVNGNLKTDLNKGLISYTGSDGIQYNYMNLPSIITVKKDAAGNKGIISNTYDASGKKLQKKVTEYGATIQLNGSPVVSNVITTTDYINGIEYETKEYAEPSLSVLQYKSVLQFISHEEGRIRLKSGDYSVTPQIPGTFNFDYFIKDHLGNVRMVLTEEQKQDIYPAATMENNSIPATDPITIEKNFYTINNGNITDINLTPITGLPYYQNNNTYVINNNPNCTTSTPIKSTDFSQKMYKINGNDPVKSGLGITLKVMAGDKLDVLGKSYYFTNASGSNQTISISNIVSGFLNSPQALTTTGVHGVVNETDITNNPIAIAGINQLFTNQTNLGSSGLPRAFINYLLFDEQFKCVGSGFSQVGNNMELKDHFTANNILHDIPVNKNGYVYIYCSNESQTDVFFDNLQVVHTRGPVVEETHYYPFGLTMAGISSKSAGGLENKKKYSGKELQSHEFSDGSGLEEYDFGARLYNQQIGRWGRTDPLASKYPMWSPYAAMADNPIRNIDPTGKEFINFDKDGNYLNSTKNNWWHNFWNGHKGRILDANGNATQKFRFADSKHDVADIQSGIIKKVQFVSEKEISTMVANSGAFSANNKTENNTLGDRYKYIIQEGVGGGKLDFSYTGIPNMYLGASDNPLDKPSPMIFLVGNVAHNHMNFGNFLFGAAGQALGYSLFELSVGAHYNSLKNPGSNGYSRQLDSEDDQYSIKLGFIFGDNRNYNKASYTGKVIVGDLEKGRMPDDTNEQ